MDAYHIALFLHIVTLLVAASATAVTKLAVGRRIRARTVREALEWHELLIGRRYRCARAARVAAAPQECRNSERCARRVTPYGSAHERRRRSYSVWGS